MKTLRIVLFALAIAPVSCGKDKEHNRYALLSYHWVETGRSLNGEATNPTQLQHIFYGGGFQGRLDYEYICGLTGDDCLPGEHYQGSWQLLSDSTLSTEVNGAIRLYFIERLTSSELWLKFDQGQNEIVSKMRRYR